MWSSSRLLTIFPRTRATLGTLSSSSRLLLIFPRSRRAFLNKSFAQAPPHQQLYGLLEIYTHRGADPCILPNVRKHACANSNHVRKIVPVSSRTGVYVPRPHAHARANPKHVRKTIPIAAQTCVCFPRLHTPACTPVRTKSNNVRKTIPITAHTRVCFPRWDNGEVAVAAADRRPVRRELSICPSILFTTSYLMPFTTQRMPFTTFGRKTNLQ